MDRMERVPIRSFFHSYAGEFDVRFSHILSVFLFLFSFSCSVVLTFVVVLLVLFYLPPSTDAARRR